MDIAAAAQNIIDQLVGAGIRASVDARDLQPPCVQLRPPTLTYRFGKGWDADWEAWVMVPDAGQTQALAMIGPFLDQVQEALHFVGQTARTDTTALGDAGFAPTYVLTFTTRIPAIIKEAAHA